jgi:hypothetical protein
MIEIDVRQVRNLEHSLDQLNDRGIAFAQRNAINDMAFATMRESKDKIREDFINRDRWTVNSIRVDRALSTRDSSEVGSTERYMAHQEFGHTSTEHTQIATPAAAGESNRARVRRKVVRRANRMANISLGNRRRSQGSRAQQNIIALKEAKADGRKFVYLDRGRVKGIYRVMGTMRKPKARMVQNMSRRVAVVPRHPWLAPSTAKVVANTPEIYHNRLQQQLDRIR